MILTVYVCYVTYTKYDAVCVCVSLSLLFSVDSLSLVDRRAEGLHSKVLSLAEHTDKVSSLDLTVSLDKNLAPLDPLGSVSANVAQLRLVVVTPFVFQIVVSDV